MYSTATFSWNKEAENVIAIIDHDEGMSVTNDVRNVIRDISAAGVDVDRHQFIYRDTELMWDGIEVHRGEFSRFIPLRTHSFMDALEKIGRVPA